MIGFDLYFPREYLKAALFNSFLSVCVLIGIFFYLNRYTHRRYFSYWTVAWLFHALWLVFCLLTQTGPEPPLLTMLKQWCVGASAVFLLWGSAAFLNQSLRPFQFVLFIIFLFTWSYVGVFHFDSLLQAQLPIFAVMGLAGVAASACFFRLRQRQAFLGAGLLSFGFGLWAVYVAAYPIFQNSDQTISAGHFVSAGLQLFIAVGMIVLVLEERRAADELNLQKIQSYQRETDFLHKKVISTEERYRSLFDQASEGILITDAEELRILELNQTAKRMLGIDNGNDARLPEFCQMQPDPGPAPKTGAEWFDLICARRTLTMVRRGGGLTPVEADGAPIHFDGRRAYQFFLRELTERARLEQQLRQAEKLSALGQMISGVAHELNNPLAVIKGYLELILRRDELSKSTRADLEKVAHEGNRAAKLVSNFLSFAREQPVHREAVDANELVGRIAELRRFDLQNARVELRLRLAPRIPATQADPDQMQQVLTNLVNNSVHALADIPGPAWIEISTEARDGFILMRVTDNGPGVPPEALPYIFEPFFTTKEVGKGTGLGLSIVHSIMADHNGRVAYETAPGGGACFVLEWPIVGALSAANRAGAPAPSGEKTGMIAASILVLDDERSIAELLGEMLSLLGYSTTLCHSAPDALDVLGRQDFDLIISDFRMPRMNGQEFFEEAVRRKPELARRVVFLTGDVVNEETQAFLSSTGNPHLAKPFQLAMVEQTVAQVLQRNANQE